MKDSQREWKGGNLSSGSKDRLTQRPPRTPRKSKIRSSVLALYAIVYAIAMLVLGGTTFEKLYSASPYHRLQADALLKGNLCIGDSLQQIRHDLAWHDGQVNHVWGLGVGLWLTPFEFVWRLIGQKWFPDRIPLGVAFALLAWYSGSTAWRIGAISGRPSEGSIGGSRREDAQVGREEIPENQRLVTSSPTRRGSTRGRPTFSLGFVWLIVLCPAVWTLNQRGSVIYEETSLYACIVSLAILVATVRVACFGQRRDFWICAVLAGLSAFVRPTHGIYGLAGMLVCSAILWFRRGQWKTVVLGNVIFAAGLIFLAITNWSRFGSPTEFGHRLTATPGIIVYMTRIDNPMKEATFVQGARELFGTLFLAKDVERLRRDEKAVPGQAPYERWRDPYLTTFDLIWAAVCATGFLGVAVWVVFSVRRKNEASFLRHCGGLLRRPTASLVVGLVIWGGLSVAALAVFYLKLPTFSYRYLLDFAPAFTALATLTWFWIARWPAWIVLPALGAWLGYEIVSARIIPAPTLLRERTSLLTELVPTEGRALAEFGGRYTSPAEPQHTGIPYNGYGWNEESRLAGAIAIFAVDRPEFIELELEPRIVRDGGTEDGSGRSDVYRAMIDNKFLPLRETRTEGNIVHVRFDVPESMRARQGDELLFLCFTSGYDKPDRGSERVLHSVRWREEWVVGSGGLAHRRFASTTLIADH